MVAHRLQASCNHDRSVASFGQELLHHLQVIYVVKDQQPDLLLLRLQVALDGFRQAILVGLPLIRQVKKGGQPGKLREERLARVSAHPQHEIILIPIAIGVLYGGLGLANATQAADCATLTHYHNGSPVQGRTQTLQNALTPGEVDVPQVRHHPGAFSPGVYWLAKERNEGLEYVRTWFISLHFPAIDAVRACFDMFG